MASLEMRYFVPGMPALMLPSMLAPEGCCAETQREQGHRSSPAESVFMVNFDDSMSEFRERVQKMDNNYSWRFAVTFSKFCMPYM